MKMTRYTLQGGDGEVGMARWRLESRERCWGQGDAKGEGKAAGVEVAKILGLAIHGQAESGGASGPACLCTIGHNSADGHWLNDVSAN